MELVVLETNSEPETEASSDRYGRSLCIAYLANLLVPYASGIAHAFVMYTWWRFLGTCEALHWTPSPAFAFYPVLCHYSLFAIYLAASSLCIYLPVRASKDNRVNMALCLTFGCILATATNATLATYYQAYFSIPIYGIAYLMAAFVQIATAVAVCQNAPKLAILATDQKDKAKESLAIEGREGKQ